jgi:hypothetical protein
MRTSPRRISKSSLDAPPVMKRVLSRRVLALLEPNRRRTSNA